MNIPKSIERIEKMRKGNKVKCPKCAKGFISAMGEPSTAYCFRCDKCGTSLILTKQINNENQAS